MVRNFEVLDISLNEILEASDKPALRIMLGSVGIAQRRRDSSSRFP